MKNFNAVKLFLIVIVSVTWGMIAYYWMNCLIKEDGYERFTDDLHSSVEYLPIGIWVWDNDGAEFFEQVKQEYEGHKLVADIVKTAELVDFSCVELEEETKREVMLRGSVFDDIYNERMGEEDITELQLYDVLLPKYFTPCVYGRYGNKAYMDAEQLVGKNLQMKDYPITFKVVGIYDNVRFGVEGNRVYYSQETYEKVIQAIYEFNEQEAKNYVEEEYSIVKIYPKSYEVKEELLEELNAKYGNAVVAEDGTMSISDWDLQLQTLKGWLELLTPLFVAFTLVFSILILILMKSEMKKRIIFGIEFLVSSVCLLIGFIANYMYVDRENKSLKEKEGELLGMLEYSMQVVYWIVIVAVVLGIAGVGMICLNRKRKSGETEHA